MATKTLYVGNLPYSATETQLEAHFAAYGASNPRIIEGRGFAFVDVDSEQLDTAIAEKHNSDMGGRTLTVNEARPKGDRPAGGGYGGGRPGGGGGGYGGGRPGGGGGGGGRSGGGGGGGGGNRFGGGKNRW